MSATTPDIEWRKVGALSEVIGGSDFSVELLKGYSCHNAVRSLDEHEVNPRGKSQWVGKGRRYALL